MRTRQIWMPWIAGALAAATLSAQAQDPGGQEPAGTTSEVIVVTASRTEQPLNEAPASLTVLDQKMIEAIPTDDYGDLLRNVAGLNVSQTSARDVNMTARGSTSSLATSQLVLVDGRSLYLDFFGFVMWDFLPVNPVEIKQIEVVNGPGSAVWGANAMTGVVNVITKRPKEMVGTSIVAGGGELATRYGSLVHAGVSERVGYKFSLGYYEQDPYDRPAGPVPGSNPPTAYPDFENTGTSQPKADVRVDWDVADDAYLSVGGGIAGTDGIIHTGTGPFDIASGSKLSYAKADYYKQAWHLGFFWNSLDADSQNLLSRGLDGKPLGFAFQTNTYNAEASNTSVLGRRQILTYGGNYRHSTFDLEVAPQGDQRTEYGAFLEDEILLGDKLRWLIGGRYDNIDPISGVFTPRTSLLYSPAPNHTVRVSYNEAFRSPSVVNNYLDVDLLNQVGPFLIPANASGNVKLKEEHLSAYEIGYVGSLSGGLTVTLAAYRNETEDWIDFYVSNVYGPANLPAPSPTLPAEVVPCFAFAPGTFPPCAAVGGGLAGVVPSAFSFRNLPGKIVDKGVEVSVQKRFARNWSWFVNGSWQDRPEFDRRVDPSEQNVPPEWRGNAGFSYDPGPWFFGANVNYQDSSYWADVLNIHASTDSFAMLNASIGVRLLDERMTLEIRGSNLTDERVLQHIFGDIISRKVTGQIGFRF